MGFGGVIGLAVAAATAAAAAAAAAAAIPASRFSGRKRAHPVGAAGRGVAEVGAGGFDGAENPFPRRKAPNLTL